MVNESQVIFMKGKEEALNKLFNGEDGVFGYAAIGYSKENNGFEDSVEDNLEAERYGFYEISSQDNPSYKRIELQPMNETTYDDSTKKVLVKFKATLDLDNIEGSQPINQIAVVDTKIPNDAGTKFYSATTFPTFTKTDQTSITFVLGFRL